MIKTEFYKKRIDGVALYRTYSDSNKTIIQIETGVEYDEAVDVADENGNIRYTYAETDRDIGKDEEDISDIIENI